MRRFTTFASLLALGASICVAAGKDGASVPVLLELFTSEGCSSCPPADRLLEELDQKQPVPGADLIVLSEHVDYWDRLGWKDPFSAPQYSARQEEYVAKLHLDDVYTPQLLVDGTFGFVGSDRHEAFSAIRKAILEPKIAIAISKIARDGNRVAAHIELPQSERPKGGKAILYVAIADNRAESHVTRGENGGRSLAHVGVARVFKQVGAVDLASGTARDVTLSVPAETGSGGMRIVAFLQDPGSGHVLGVAVQKL
jgi:hypothetical protein